LRGGQVVPRALLPRVLHFGLVHVCGVGGEVAHGLFQHLSRADFLDLLIASGASG